MTAQTASRLSGLQFVNPQHSDGLASRHRTVPAGGDAPLPASPVPLDVVVDGAGRRFELDEWNLVTHGTALVVVRRGVVVHEWYADGVGRDDLLLGASMTKSALAHLVGLALRSGALRLDDQVVDHVPELTGTGYEHCTVRHLATMTSGVDWVEDHRDPNGPASRLVACFGGEGGRSRDLLGEVRPRWTPGLRWEYSTADSQVLDWVRERATETSYDAALAGLWRELGCSSDALVGIDEDGVAMAGGSLAATARDWARLTMLQLDGTVDGRRLLDLSWVEDSSRAPEPFMRPGRLPSTITTHAGFGMHWWPTTDDGRRVSADGSRGQFGYAARDLGVVVVKTSRWPYEDAWVDRQLRDLSYLGLRAVAEAAGPADQQHDSRKERP